MSETLKVYNADEVIIAVGPVLVESGYADDEFCRIEYESDDTEDVVGTDGEVAVSRTNDLRATITLLLLQTADAAIGLSALSNLTRKAAAMAGAIVPTEVFDPQNVKLYAAENSWVQRPPDVSYVDILGADVVIHLAAQVGVADSMTDSMRYLDDNTRDTMALLQTIADPPAFRLNGIQIVDGNSVDRLAPSFSKRVDHGYATQRTLTGAYAVTNRLRTFNSRRSPVRGTQYTWTINVRFCDETLFPLIQRISERPIATKFHDKLDAFEFMDGDASTTTFYLQGGREILSTAHTASGGIPANTGGTAESLTITRLDTGANYTVVYDTAPTVGTEVRVNTTGTDAFKELIFNTAPPNVQGVIQVRYWPLYPVVAGVQSFEFSDRRDCTVNVGYSFSIMEI